MSKNTAQVFAANPITSIGSADLVYVAQSGTTDAAISGASLNAFYSPIAGSTSLITVGTITTGTWNGSLITGTYGGTGVNNGASTITIGGNVTFSGAFTFTGTITATTSVTFPTSGTLATTSQLPSLPLSLANGGTNANLTASNGGIFYSSGTAGAILSGTSTASQILLSGANTTPAWSVATYPSAVGSGGTILRSNGSSGWATSSFTISSTTTINQLLYSSSNNTITGLSTSDSGVLVTSSTGIPSILAAGTTGQLLQASTSGTPGWSTSTYPSTNAVNTLLYASSANVMAALATADSGILVTSSGGVPSISTTAPAGITLPQPLIEGVTNASSASAGNVGEYMSSNIAAGSGTSLSNAMPKNITSLSLTAGDWNVFGNVYASPSAAAITEIIGWTSLSSATLPDSSLVSLESTTGDFGGFGITVPYLRVNVSSTTTVYLSIQVNFSSGTCTGSGSIFARRVR